VAGFVTLIRQIMRIPMTTAPDPLSFEVAAARIGRILAVVAVLGTCGSLAIGVGKQERIPAGSGDFRAELSLAA